MPVRVMTINSRLLNNLDQKLKGKHSTRERFHSLAEQGKKRLTKTSLVHKNLSQPTKTYYGLT